MDRSKPNPYSPGTKVALKSFAASINTQVAAQQSGNPTANNFAVGLTKITTGVKSIDFADILGGTLVSNSGTFASGVTQTSFDTSINSKVTTYTALAGDTIGDPLGNDTATNFPSAAIKILTMGNDTADGTSGSDLIATRDGDDTVNGLAGNDKIIGGAGIDTLNGGEGVDHLYGYASNDSLSGGAGNDKLVGGLGNDTLNGGAGDDEIQGQTDDDVITSGTGNDAIYGGLGNDSITIDGTGNKTINGGAGTDSLSISYSGISSLSDFTMSYVGDSAATFTLTDSNGGAINFTGIENLTVNSIAYSLTEGDLSGTNITNIFWDGANDTIHGFGSLTDTGAYFSQFNIMNFNSLTGMSGSDGFILRLNSCG